MIVLKQETGWPEDGKRMARAAGGTWQDPDSKMMESIREEEEKRIGDLQTKK